MNGSTMEAVLKVGGFSNSVPALRHLNITKEKIENSNDTFEDC